MVQTVTPESMVGLLDGLKSADNSVRQQAEARVTELRASSARDLFQGFLSVIQAGQPDHQTIALACLLFKKFYLDDRKSEEGLEQLNAEDITLTKNTFKQLLNMEEPMSLLRRKAEVLCKVHRKEESYAELVQSLRQLALQEPNSDSPAVIKGKELSMYMFELLSEFHLPQEQIEQNQVDFMAMFSDSLRD